MGVVTTASASTADLTRAETQATALTVSKPVPAAALLPVAVRNASLLSWAQRHVQPPYLLNRKDSVGVSHRPRPLPLRHVVQTVSGLALPRPGQLC